MRSRTDSELDLEEADRAWLAESDLGAVLKPILAGARARGVADGLELIGVGAVLIDATGRVLHAGGRALRMMAGWLRVVEDHLVPERPGDDRVIADLVGSAIAGRPTPAGVRLGGLGGEPLLQLRALMVPGDGDPSQRLHAVIVLDEA